MGGNPFPKGQKSPRPQGENFLRKPLTKPNKGPSEEPVPPGKRRVETYIPFGRPLS